MQDYASLKGLATCRRFSERPEGLANRIFAGRRLLPCYAELA